MVMNVTSWWVIFCTLFFGGSELSVKRRSRSSGRRRCLRQWHYNTGFFGLGSYLAYITWARAVVEYALFRMTHSEKKIQKRKHKKSSRLPWRDDVTLFSQHNQSQMTQRLLLSSKSSPLNFRAEQSPCYLFFHSQSSCITCGFSKPKRMRPGIFLSIFWAI